MKTPTSLLPLSTVLGLTLFFGLLSGLPAAAVDVSGEYKTWHKLTLTFDGPTLSETGTPNPFTDYQLDVTFTSPDYKRTLVVPGYFAADGYAAHTGSTEGNKWRVHFCPDQVGTWKWKASFIDVKDGKEQFSIHGREGVLPITATDKSGRDFRAHGRLVPEGHFLRHAHSKELFLKSGADAPENLLAYADFDGEFKNDGVKDNLIKTWEPHIQDWKIGDPTWAAGDGQGLIGAINYLAWRGMNVISFLPLNIGGDDENVYPYINAKTFDRFDVSKLDQWEIVFEHAQTKGVFLHFKTQEAENQTLLDDGALGPNRKLYYRELVARFGHHNALNWNLGEENGVWKKKEKQPGQSTEQRIAMVKWFQNNDPYKHHVVIHNGASFDDLLGPDVAMSGVSLQTNKPDFSRVYPSVLKWRNASALAGHPWAIATDEPGDAQHALLPDAEDPKHNTARQNALWGTFMAGGYGVEWYFGYQHDHSDLTCQDWRSREAMWDQSRHALNFFKKHKLPLENMHPRNELIDENHWVLAGKNAEGRWEIVVYMREGGTATIDLPNSRWTHGWFDPRTGKGAPKLLAADRTYGAHELQRTAPDKRDWVLLICEADPSGLDLVPKKKKKTVEYALTPAVFPADAKPPLPIPEPMVESEPEPVVAAAAPEPAPRVVRGDLPIAKTFAVENAEYETYTERVLVTPARKEWKVGRELVGRGLEEQVDNATGQIKCLVEVPAVYKTVTKRRIKPGTGTYREQTSRSAELFRSTPAATAPAPAPRRMVAPAPYISPAPVRPAVTTPVRPSTLVPAAPRGPRDLPIAETIPLNAPGAIRGNTGTIRIPAPAPRVLETIPPRTSP